MRRHVFGCLSAVLACASASPIGYASEPKAIDGVREGRGSAPRPAVLSPSSVDFETPILFSDTLPLQVFQSFQAGAFFLGTGAVLEVASFEVQGATGRSGLTFNGRTATNGDGSVPQLPELVLFVTPDLSGVAPKQTVSIDVGSKRDEGRFVVLVALDISLGVVDFDFVQLTPQMQTLTVSSSTPEIVIVGLFGEAEAKILVADNLSYN